MACPHCGNRNPSLIETNGERATSPDYTLLCTARVPLGESSLLREDEEVGEDRLTICAMQWEPNAERYEQYAINQRWLRGEIDTATHDAGMWS